MGLVLGRSAVLAPPAGPLGIKMGLLCRHFNMFVAHELFVLVSWVLAIVFSVWGFRKRQSNLQFLNVTTIVLTSILWLLDSWGML